MSVNPNEMKDDNIEFGSSSSAAPEDTGPSFLKSNKANERNPNGLRKEDDASPQRQQRTMSRKAKAKAKANPAPKKSRPNKLKSEKNFNKPVDAAGFRHVYFQIVSDKKPSANNGFSIYECDLAAVASQRPLGPLLEQAQIINADILEAGFTEQDSVKFLEASRSLLVASMLPENMQSFGRSMLDKEYAFWPSDQERPKECIIDDFISWADLKGEVRVALPVQAEILGGHMASTFLWMQHGYLGDNFDEITYKIHVGGAADEEFKVKLVKWLETDLRKLVDFPFSVERRDKYDAFTARTNLECDQASANDYLGFRPLAKSLGAFVKHRATGLPLSIAIDGPWGTGKSSLMLMLRQELDRKALLSNGYMQPSLLREAVYAAQLFYFTIEPILLLVSATVLGTAVAATFGVLPAAFSTLLPPLYGSWISLGVAFYLGVWIYARQRRRDRNKRRSAEGALRQFDTVFINAWRHGHGTRLKAAIMKHVIDRLIVKHGARFFLKLQLARFNRFSFLATTFRSGLQSTVFLVVLFGAGIAVFAGVDLTPIGLDISPEKSSYLGPFMSLGAIALKYAKSAQAANMKDFLTSPDYEKLAGPDDEIEQDFERILALLKSEGRSLAIFIDDLDRCSPETVHQVVEALNVFFGKHDNECLFVLGMHKEMVATSLEVAYEKMAAKLLDNPLLKEQLPYGRRFLEKIVQFSVPVPTPKPSDINGYVQQMTTGSGASDIIALAEKKLTNDNSVSESITGAWTALYQSVLDLWHLILKQTPANHRQTSIAIETDISNLEPEAKAEFDHEMELLKKEEARLKEAAAFSPTDTNVASIFEDIRPALRSNPRQYKRFFNQFRFNRFVSESLNGMSSDVAERHDAIIAVLALEHPFIYHWAFENLSAPDGQRRTEAALYKVQALCQQKAPVAKMLPKNPSSKVRIRHAHKSDQALQDIVSSITPSAGTGK